MKKSAENHPTTSHDLDIPDSILDLLGLPRTESKMRAGKAVISLGLVMALVPTYPIAGAIILPEALRQCVLFYKAGKRDMKNGEDLMNQLENPHAKINPKTHL